MELHKLIQSTQTRRYGSSGESKFYSKGELLAKIGEMSEEDVNTICSEILSLVHYKDTTVNLHATDKEPSQLLHEFWQRSSDACPLEATEAEKQESEFEEFVDKRFWQLEYTTN